MPVYIKFAGAAVMVLHRWLQADEVPSDDESARDHFLEHIHSGRTIIDTPPVSLYVSERVLALTWASVFASLCVCVCLQHCTNY